MHKAFLFLIATVLLFPKALLAVEQVYKEEQVLIVGKRIMAPTKETGETVYTGFELTKEGLSLQASPSNLSVWSQLSLLPGIIFSSPDPANLASTQASISVRGIRGSLGTMSVEGIPVYGGNPIGPRPYIFDLENFESVAVYKGIAPHEVGTGAGTRGGIVVLRPSWAKENFSVETNYSRGSFDFERIYIRLDSGRMQRTQTQFSISGSISREDKWKGGGKLGPRNNLNITLLQPFGERTKVKIFANFNHLKHDKFRSLSYLEVRDKDNNYRLDYNEDLFKDPSKDWLYYGFNKLDWKNKDVYAFFELDLRQNLRLSVKPYYREEQKEDWTGSSSVSGPTRPSRPGVNVSSWTVERKGIISELNVGLERIKGLLGYHYEESKWTDSVQLNYWLNPDSSLRFVGWGRFTESDRPSVRRSPYCMVSGKAGNLDWQLGLKYFEMEESRSLGYVTKYKANGEPYLEREPKMDYGGKVYSLMAPSFGVSYSFSPEIEPYMSFGRTFQQPYAYMPIINLYYRLYEKFKLLNISLEDLFGDYKPEKTDSLDLGLRIRKGMYEIYPVFFIQKHKNLWTPITLDLTDPENPAKVLTDPSTGRPVSFNTFVGKARGYGFEVTFSYRPLEALNVFLNPCYTVLTYEEDILSQGIKYEVKGKQVVNVPKWSVSGGFRLKASSFEIVPIFRYVGKTYGDLARTERIPEYATFDIKASYSLGNLGVLKNVKLSLEGTNIFNKKYIIPGYYFGPPLAVYGSVNFSF